MSIHDVVSDSGLVRGVGLYTRSKLTFGGDSKLSVYELSAGHSLYSKDTSRFAAPYNPTVAKPFHVLWSYFQDGTYFNSSITGRPQNVRFSCIYGRDGSDDTDWTVKVDNKQCVAPSERGQRDNREYVAPSESVFMEAHREATKYVMHNMLLLVALAVMVGAVSVFQCERAPKVISNENAPLLRRC